MWTKFVIPAVVIQTLLASTALAVNCNPLFLKHGRGSELKLSDGTVVPLPFIASDITMQGLLTSADPGVIRHKLQHLGLQPVTTLLTGRPLVMLLTQEYGNSSIGRYTEFIAAALAYEPAPSERGIYRPLRTGILSPLSLLENPMINGSDKAIKLVLMKVLVTTENAQELGNRVWKMGKKVVDIETGKGKDLTISDGNGLIFQASSSLMNPLIEPTVTTPALDYSVVTNGAIQARARNGQGQGFALPAFPSRGYFTYGATPDGRDLQQMDLVPLSIVRISGTSLEMN